MDAISLLLSNALFTFSFASVASQETVKTRFESWQKFSYKTKETFANQTRNTLSGATNSI